ncbi:CorA family divalent cation transporter [Jannaschia rubra]|uniref:Zinc transport protein ZntB n=1 Tax=Jannaschia rubra TaxID=282197 RepID=A0A0M6XP18_9RHOB|nr:CorA family divalent cation transporter [Jannaschia rubra]CTQ31923.1 Zinc transport protein ZntB [Jannaschia rubra]SFG78867.1 zinc transporter [Jannaschia rubra]
MTQDIHRAFHGFVLSGPRRSLALAGPDLGDALEGEELAWAHLPFDVDHPAPALAWMEAHVPGLDHTTRLALTGETTRPRALATEIGFMLILRGVNLNAGAEPENMISCRIYLDTRRAVTLSREPLQSVGDLAEQVRAGRGPTTPGGFLHDLAEALILRIEDVLEKIEDDTDALQDKVAIPAMDSDTARATRTEATRLRRMVLGLRRHISPQRDALAAAASQMHDLLGKTDRRRLLEVQERHQRAVEELDTLAGRLTLVRDDIKAEQDERTNRNLYILSIMSALFLPLGFLTGLLGVNLGGIPGSSSPIGFAAFCALLAVIFGVQVMILRRLRGL